MTPEIRLAAMDPRPLENVNVSGFDDMPTPEAIQAMVPLTARAAATVARARRPVRGIIERTSRDCFVVVGPCSIHDPDAALEYARPAGGAGGPGGRHPVRRHAGVLREAAHVDRVEGVRQRPADGRFVPHPGGHARRAPAARAVRRHGTGGRNRGAGPAHAAVSRRPDRLVRHWRAHDRVADAPGDGERPVGARWVQEQHRRRPRDRDQRHPVGGRGRTASWASTGRGGPRSCAPAATGTGTWCCAAAGAAPTTTPSACGSPSARSPRPACPPTSSWTARTSNCLKDHTLQPLVFHDCVHQIVEGNTSIVGLMMESNLEAGQPGHPGRPGKLRYGVSVTDPCVDWTTTEEVLLRAREDLAPVLAARRRAAG